MNKKVEVGSLNVTIRPIYAQSRDSTANREQIFQLQPNVFTAALNTLPIPLQQSSATPSTSRVVSTRSLEAINTSATRNEINESHQSDRSTILPNAEGLSQVTQRQIQLIEEMDKPAIEIENIEMQAEVSIDQISVVDPSIAMEARVNVGKDIKRVEVVQPEEEEPVVDISKVYFSKCTAIVRKNDSTRTLGLRQLNRARHDYIESLSCML